MTELYGSTSNAPCFRVQHSNQKRRHSFIFMYKLCDFKK